MTPTDFRTIRTRLGLSQSMLGRLIGLSTRQVSALECGSSAITPMCATFMRLLDDEPDLMKRATQLRNE